jgi:hypothetical protein
MLRRNLLAGCFQPVQIAHGGVIQGEFGGYVRFR